MRAGLGSGPFAFSPGDGNGLRLTREITSGEDDEAMSREEVLLEGAKAEAAVSDFVAGKSDLVLGGTFTDFPLPSA